MRVYLSNARAHTIVASGALERMYSDSSSRHFPFVETLEHDGSPDGISHRITGGTHTTREGAEDEADDMVRGLLSAGEVRTTSCGCCTNGCTCWNHQDHRIGRPVLVCAFHLVSPHPHETSN